MLKLLFATVTTLLLTLGVANADDSSGWTKLNGPEIEKALAGSSLIYPNEDGAMQDFSENGATTWVHGFPSSGEWKVSDTQYCSVWPPSAAWVCYDVTINDDKSAVRFIGESGKIYEGYYQ